jgi:hypothetical protein
MVYQPAGSCLCTAGSQKQASGTSATGDERSEEVNPMMKISVRKAGAIRLTANCYYCPGCRGA